MTTKSKDTSGSAFPRNEKSADGSHWHSHDGMTLRDYFAAKALQGLLSVHAVIGYPGRRESIAQEAYLYADAMLKAREEPLQENE